MDTRKIKLKNTHKTAAFVATMTHDLVCANAGNCTCTTRQVPQGKGKKPKLTHDAETFRIEVGAWSEPLPIEVGHLPLVAAGLRRGTLVKEDLPTEVESIG